MKNLTITGRVGKDAEVRTTQAGDKVATFSVAVNDGYGDNQEAYWFDVSIWGKRGEKVAQHINKGDSITVTGDLKKREKDGRTYLGLRADNFSFISTGRSSNPRGDDGYGQPQTQGQPADLDGDSIPF